MGNLGSRGMVAVKLESGGTNYVILNVRVEPEERLLVEVFRKGCGLIETLHLAFHGDSRWAG